MKIDSLLETLTQQNNGCQKALNELVSGFRAIDPQGNEKVMKMQSDIPSLVEKMKNSKDPQQIIKDYTDGI